MEKNLKHYLLTSAVFFAFSLMSIAMFIVSIIYNNNSKTSYDDLIYKELTVESIRKIIVPDGYDMYYIDVVEEEKNIEVNNLLTNGNVRDGIQSLNKGDTIYCHLKKDSSCYELVELKTENSTILSLDDYNEIYNRESILGLIISPVLFAIMLGIAIKAFVAYMKEKKKTDKS